MMRWFIRQMRVVLPPPLYFGMAAVLLALLEGAMLWIACWGTDTTKGSSGGRAGGVTGRVRALLGLCVRLLPRPSFFTVWRASYRTWLAQTPWLTDKPLPLGPIHIVWQDLLVLLVLELLSYQSRFLLIGATSFLFLVPHAVFAGIAFRLTGMPWRFYGLLFLLGGSIILWPYRVSHGLTAVALYGVIYWSFPPMLEGLSALAKNESAARFDAFLQSNLREIRKRVGGWPNHALHLDLRFPGLRYAEGCAIALVIGWWLFVPLGSPLQPRRMAHRPGP